MITVLVSCITFKKKSFRFKQQLGQKVWKYRISIRKMEMFVRSKVEFRLTGFCSAKGFNEVNLFSFWAFRLFRPIKAFEQHFGNAFFVVLFTFNSSGLNSWGMGQKRFNSFVIVVSRPYYPVKKSFSSSFTPNIWGNWRTNQESNVQVHMYMPDQYNWGETIYQSFPFSDSRTK